MSVTLSQGLHSVFEDLLGSAEEARKQIRAAHVEEIYKETVEEVFKKAASLVLKHTNAVYFFKEEGIPQFIVYSDDSSIRAALDSRQELLKIALFKRGLAFSDFKVLPARKSIKTRYPFENIQILPQKPVFRELSADELDEVEEFVASIEDEGVREAFKQALISNLKTHD